MPFGEDMPGKIPREFIDELIARVDLVDLVHARIPLKKAGVNYSARCPFHSEKTPSFTVNRDKQFYHCFGCGAHGNAISFLMEYERQSFTEAIETLAESLGLRIPRESSGESKPAQVQQNHALYDLQEVVARFYAQQLRKHPEAARAVAYLKKRGVSGEIAKHYLLGYAPSGWRNLPPTLPNEQLQMAGLVIAKGHHGCYDRFRDRIIFPIRDRRGRVIGFGGRVLGEQTPKYLNSPETPLFKKHREVYGLYELLQTVRKPERILVTEGYMDVIALAQHGIPYAVAALGTATSREHINLLFRYTDELVFCFDGDSAGQKAAWKALEASLPELRDGRRISFLMLPSNHDPDSLVREEGVENFSARLAGATPLSDYLFQQLSRPLDIKTIEGKATLAERAKALISQIPFGTFRELMQVRLQELSGDAQVQREQKSTPSQQDKQSSARRVRPSALRTILALLLQNPAFFRVMDAETRTRLTDHEGAGVFAKKLFCLLEERPGISVGGVLEHFRGEPEENQVRTLSTWNTLVPEEGAETEFRDALKQFCKQRKDERLTILLSKEATSGLTPDEREEMRRLFSQK